jgi:hypothetical protein
VRVFGMISGTSHDGIDATHRTIHAANRTLVG